MILKEASRKSILCAALCHWTVAEEECCLRSSLGPSSQIWRGHHQHSVDAPSWLLCLGYSCIAQEGACHKEMWQGFAPEGGPLPVHQCDQMKHACIDLEKKQSYKAQLSLWQVLWSIWGRNMFCDSKYWSVNSALCYIPSKTLSWTRCSKIQEVFLGNSSYMQILLFVS